jgi:Zn-finger nucleic acid-binding protein
MQSILACPACKHPLTQYDVEIFPILLCEHCHGCLVPLRKLSRYAQSGHVQKIAEITEATAPKGKKLCPTCRSWMLTKSLLNRVGTYELDVCRKCDEVWFDAGELEMAPTTPEVIDTTQKFLLDNLDQFSWDIQGSLAANVLLAPRDEYQLGFELFGVRTLRHDYVLALSAFLADVPQRKKPIIPGE